MIEVIVCLLLVLLVVQQMGWMLYSQKLVDKAMSRSYYEYKQSEAPALQSDQSPYNIGIKLPEDKGPSPADLLNQSIQIRPF